MTKFKIGDKVRIIGNHPNSGCITTVISVRDTWAAVDGGLKNPINNAPNLINLELYKESDMSNLKVGDIIKSTVNVRTSRAIVLNITDSFLVYTCFIDNSIENAYTLNKGKQSRVGIAPAKRVSELLESGQWTIDNEYGKEPQITELTLEEVAKLAGVDVKQLRIKE